MSRKSAVVGEKTIRFEVRDGMRRIGCVVLDDALEGVAALAVPSSLALRRRAFDRFRTRINAAARLKLDTLPAGSAGPIVLSREDLRCMPPEQDEPSYGSSPRGMPRHATTG